MKICRLCFVDNTRSFKIDNETRKHKHKKLHFETFFSKIYGNLSPILKKSLLVNSLSVLNDGFLQTIRLSFIPFSNPVFLIVCVKNRYFFREPVFFVPNIFFSDSNLLPLQEFKQITLLIIHS